MALDRGLSDTRAILQTRMAIFLVLFGLFFNALLAFLNANVMRVATPHVMAMEALTLLGIAVVVKQNWESSMRPWLAFGYVFVLLFVWMLLFNAFFGQSMSPKPLRDILLIVAFGLLGMVFGGKDDALIKLMRIACVMVVAIIFLENYATDSYSKLFNPASYYMNTRGIEGNDATLAGELGLFVNTGLLEGRFTLGFLTTHRLASLFLEQTSLGNFAILITIAASLLWDKLKRVDRIGFVFSALLCIAATDSRLAIGISALVVVLHVLAPRLPRNLNLFVMPVFLILAFLTLYDPRANELLSDTLPGRFTWSLTQLSWIDWRGFFGGRPDYAAYSMDSGYSYFIYSQTLFGLLALWLFSGRILPQNTIQAKRMAYYLAVFVTINLMVGPTMLSIKCAALLWLFVGYAYKNALVAQQPTKAL